MKKAGNLVSQIVSQVFPSGAPENLSVPLPDGTKSQIRQVFDESFAEIAKWVDCEKTNNVDIVEFCKTHFKVGMTILTKPRGRVKRVFTVNDANYSHPVYYRHVDWPEPEGMALARTRWVKSNAQAQIPLGFLPADASTDSPLGRSHAGVWATHDGNIYVWPWIQSTEFVVVEWDGIKSEWGDHDVVTESQEYKVAVTDYFIYRYNYYYGAVQKSDSAKVEYDRHLADLMWECRKNTKRLEENQMPPYRDRHFRDFFPPQTQQPIMTGTINIPQGVSSGTVTGLGLSPIPKLVLLTVSMPPNGFVLQANAVGEPTQDGFLYQLTGITDSNQYVLNYEIF